MTKPYLIISDVHLHAWSAFQTPTPDGTNGRLQILLKEIRLAAQTLIARGGDHMVVSGDLFHVRGNIAPSVLNPTMDLFRELLGMGLTVHIIPGNHDLEGKHSERLSSAVTALEGIGCKVYHHPMTADLGGQLVRFVPWFNELSELRSEIEGFCQDASAAGEWWSETDLIIHAPINGVIMGIPDHGLDPEELRLMGFKRVFAGHYHNHKQFEGGSVYSVGALAHHTWSDVGSKAGHVMVYPDRVEFYESQAPSFVEVTENTPESDIPKLVAGNYVRVRVDTSKASEIEKMREYLLKRGALGVVVISVKKPDIQRATVQVSAGASVESSVSNFVRGMGLTDPSIVERVALEVLAQAEVRQ